MDSLNPLHDDKRLLAIDYYHSLIARDLSAAEEQLEWLLEEQRNRNILFGNRPLAYSLRPTFLTEQQYQYVQDVVYMLRQAILRIAQAYFHNHRILREELGLEEWEIELASIPTKIIRLSATARLDSFMSQGSFRFVEVNAETPAGMAYIHELSKIFREMPIFKAFTEKYPARYISPLEHLINSLVAVYHEQFDGEEEHPRFAIVDHLDVPTYWEFLLMKDYLERHGYPCEIVDPRELELHDGWLYANGKRIDILYRRLLMNEFYEIKDACQAYLEGYKAGKTCFLNSFRTKMAHKKAIMALLTDKRFNHVLTPVQLRTVMEHIPWTRRIKEQKTDFRGLSIDLLEFIRANQKYFVIKPNDAYGGKEVTIGKLVSPSEWEEAIEHGLIAGYVVQEIVDVTREGFFIPRDGIWDVYHQIVDLDPYLNGPLMGGCLTRVSSLALANVTAGGGTLPLFILRHPIPD